MQNDCGGKGMRSEQGVSVEQHGYGKLRIHDAHHQLAESPAEISRRKPQG